MCGAPPASDATQCAHCGARLATVACPSCFGMIFTGSKFCPHCGAKIERAKEDESKPRPCPRCHTPLEAVALGSTKVHECPKCEGLWIDTATFNEICADRDKQAAVLGVLPATPHAAPLVFHLDEAFYIPTVPSAAMLMNRVKFRPAPPASSWRFARPTASGSDYDWPATSWNSSAPAASKNRASATLSNGKPKSARTPPSHCPPRSQSSVKTSRSRRTPPPPPISSPSSQKASGICCGTPPRRDWAPIFQSCKLLTIS